MLSATISSQSLLALDSFTMTVGMLTAIALAWQSTHDVFRSKTAR